MWSNPRLVHAGIAAAFAVLTGIGCGGPSGTFYVVQNQVPGAGCTIPGTEGALYLGQGTLDVRASAGSGYLLFPLLKNDLPAEGSGGTEPNRIALDGFEVDVKVIDGPAAALEVFGAVAGDPSMAALLRYREAWSGTVTPGGGTTGAAVTVFPAEAARLLREADALASASARIEVQLRATGRTLTGGLKSDAFTFPLRLCDGCLINSISACPAPAPVLQGGICNPGQDAPVDCCTDGAELICPATSAP